MTDAVAAPEEREEERDERRDDERDDEEREFLLRSLRDLDAEFAAGDIDEADYHTLRDDYTARAAALLRPAEPVLGGGGGGRGVSSSWPACSSPPRWPGGRWRGRRASG